jgi:hypothetical protein
VTPRVTAFALLAWSAVALARSSDSGDGRRLISERLPRIEYRGGPFLRSPAITTVTFTGDDPARVARLERFGEQVAQSDWWRAVTDSYCAKPADCIGLGKAARSVRLDKALPRRVRDVDVEALLEAEALSGTLSTLDGHALVIAYLPAGVVMSDAFSPRYCDAGPRAFHRLLRAADISIPFAVIPRCGDEAETTITASHEILEATTNPDPNKPGFRLPAGSATVAFAGLGAEPADPCNLINRDRPRAAVGRFAVQRAWSNRAAAAGTDPCVPARPERPYLALIPRTPIVRLSSPGARTSIVLDGVSDRPVERWTVSVRDLTAEDDGMPYVDARIDRTQVVSGDTITLTLKLLRVSPRRQLSIIGLMSRLDGQQHVWPLAVSMR